MAILLSRIQSPGFFTLPWVACYSAAAGGSVEAPGAQKKAVLVLCGERPAIAAKQLSG
jgi:hypothetical protein